jgi:hypothetical protein
MSADQSNRDEMHPEEGETFSDVMKGISYRDKE